MSELLCHISHPCLMKSRACAIIKIIKTCNEAPRSLRVFFDALHTMQDSIQFTLCIGKEDAL